jgi:hypothetical protein
MKSFDRKCLFVIINISAGLLFTTPACAYLDPGTISYFLQILIAGLVGISVTIKLYWSSIAGFFKRDNNKNSSGGLSGGGCENKTDETDDNNKKAD